MARPPEVAKIKLNLTKKQLHALGRIERWERESENTVIELTPGYGKALSCAN